MDETTSIRGVVLLGPPGSGKSFISHLLAQRGIAHYTDLEAELLHRFGTGTTFAQNKTLALQFIQQHYESSLTSTKQPIIIESTGISDRPILETLQTKYPLIFVKIATPKSICLERIRMRSSGKNLNNDLSFSEKMYEFWYAEIEPTYHFAQSVDGTQADEAVTQIRELLGD